MTLEPSSCFRSDKRRAVTLVAALFVVAAAISSAEAGDTDPGVGPAGVVTPPSEPKPDAPPPIWVPNVVRIDRTKQTHERIEVIDERRPFIGAAQAAPGEDGSFSTDGGRIRIAGIHLPDRNRLCTAEDGRRWACGVRAYVAFTSRVTLKKLACRPRGVAETGLGLFDCEVGHRSIAQSLVGEGWAEVDEATADATLSALGARARAAGRGLWAKEPPGQTSASPLGPAPAENLRGSSRRWGSGGQIDHDE